MGENRQLTRSEHDESSLRLAVLIDADNAQAAVIDGLLAEVARFGEATVKRIYGDFTSPTSASWKAVLQKHAIKPVQQFAYTKGKNATDSTLIIDAMDLLYTRKFDGFCLVTSDSDFTGLAMRLREEGIAVFGFGEQKTPESFRNACHKFILTEVLRPPKETAKPTAKDKKSTTEIQPAPPAKEYPPIPLEFIKEAIEKTAGEDGWAHMGAAGSYLTKLQPDFDPRIYGHKKLSDLFRANRLAFVIDERSKPGQSQKILYVQARAGK